MSESFFFPISSSKGLIPGILNLCDGDSLVIFVNGGNQTRIGPHRMHVRLSHALGKINISSYRFDFPGCGDSSSDFIDFIHRNLIISEIFSLIEHKHPHFKKIFLVGLCDGASTILLSDAIFLPRCSGIILINPWARQRETHAKTMLKNYYKERLFSFDFWQKLFKKEFQINDFISDFKNFLVDIYSENFSSSKKKEIYNNNYVDKMLNNWTKSYIPCLLVISSKDLTASEFMLAAERSMKGSKSLSQSIVIKNNDADHTFSSLNDQTWLQDKITDFVSKISKQNPKP